MLTIADPIVRQGLRSRITNLPFDATRQWGAMTVHQMMCHLTDAFRLTTGEKTASSAENWFNCNVLKFIALNVPLPWPKGVATRPEMDQKQAGTPPREFESDKAILLDYFDRFCRQPRDFVPPAHPIFGKMSIQEWDRWGYLHVDHHLRQFGN